MVAKLNVLVTGGAGFIGSHLVDGLLAAGHRVRVIDALVPQVHGNNPSLQNLDTRAEFIRGDVANPLVVRAALADVDVVFHQAAEVGVAQSMYEMDRYVRANTYATSVLLQELVAHRGRIRKLVVASSMSIYGEGAYECSACHKAVFPQLRPTSQLLEKIWEVRCPKCGMFARPVPTSEDKPLYPTSVYAITKQDQEQLCLVVGRAYDIPTIALRYFNTYGPRQALSNPYTGVCAIFSARLLNDQPPVVFEDGNQTRDFVHVSDIVQANLLAMESDSANYNVINIGTGKPTSVRQVAECLAEGLGRKLRPSIAGKYREGDIRHCIADITRARQLLGFEPRVGFSDGLAELLHWVRSQTARDEVAQATAELAARNLVR